MTADLAIRPFAADDAAAVQAMFVAVNQSLAPPAQLAAFEAYIERSVSEEISRIEAYYAERRGGFWVATREGGIVGMFGLEQAGDDAMELRRMYVDPAARRGGIARQMLQYAEDECRRRRFARLELSTSELQPAALALYHAAGYRLVQEETADQASNKTVGGGIRRFHFEKRLG